MTTRMLINATARNELRIAIVEDGELLELDIEASETSTIKGNIYKGVVHNVEGSLEAAFVDFGAHKQGFLPFSEVSPSQYVKKANGSRPRIQDVMKRGQDIVVQVGKDAVGDKGATLTTNMSLPGRYTVLMPGSEAQGVSRKIEDEKMRRRLKSMVSRVKKPPNCGFIVRTAGLNQTRIGIQKDLDALHSHYQKVMKAADIARAPSILHAEPDLIARTLRDYFND
ncbi:MAG: ribonuclease E/G, partial [Myxococcota bacterium]